jgi:hypothetical protein
MIRADIEGGGRETIVLAHDWCAGFNGRGRALLRRLAIRGGRSEPTIAVVSFSAISIALREPSLSTCERFVANPPWSAIDVERAIPWVEKKLEVTLAQSQPRNPRVRAGWLREIGSPRYRGREIGQSPPIRRSRQHHHGSVPSFACVNVPVGPSGPSSATRTASAAPSRTVSVPV